MAEGSRRFDPTPTKALPEDEQALPTQRTPSGITVRDKPESTDTDFSDALRSGVNQLEAGARGAVAAVGAAVGAEDFAEEQARAAERNLREANRLAPPIRDINEVKNSADFFNYFEGLVGTQIPIMAGLIAGGPAAIGAKRIAQRAGVRAADKVSDRAALIAGTASTGSAIETGSIFNEAVFDEDIRDGNDLSTVGQRSILGGIAAGSLEALPIVMAADRLGIGRSVRNNVERGLGSRVARAAGASAVAEGATEASQTVIERATLKTLNENFEIFDEEGRNEILNATVAGALIGGGLGGLTGIPNPNRERSSTSVRLDELEEQDEAISLEANRGREALGNLPGFNDDITGLDESFDINIDPDTEVTRLSRRFIGEDKGTLTDGMVRRNAIKGAPIKPVHIQAIRQIADGDVELTPAIRRRLEPLFPTFNNGESILDSMIESLSTRLGDNEVILDEGGTQFEMVDNTPTQEEVIDPVSGEVLPAAQRATPGEVGFTGNQLGSLKKELTSRPDLQTGMELRAAQINANRRNNIEASLVDAFDAVSIRKRDEQGLRGAELNEAMDKAGHEQFQAAVGRATTQSQVQRLTELFQQGTPRDFLRNFQVISKKRQTFADTGPFDFTEQETNRVTKNRFKGQVGDSQFAIEGSKKVIEAPAVTRVAMGKLGINPDNASVDEIARAFFDGVASLRTPPIFGDEVVPSSNEKLATKPEPIKKSTIVYRPAGREPVTFGEIIATPEGKDNARLAALVGEQKRLPQQISELEKPSNITKKQQERLTRLKARAAELPGQIEAAQVRVAEADKQQAATRTEFDLGAFDPDTIRQTEGQEELAAERGPDEGPAINFDDIPAADRGRNIPEGDRAPKTSSEQEFVDGLADMFGFDINVEVVAFPDSRSDFGWSIESSNTIVVDANLSPALRIETIAHEAGHLLLSKLSKRVLSKTEQKLATEMREAFLEWRKTARAQTVREVVNAKRPFVTSVEMLNASNNPDAKISELSDKDAQYLLDFHEWFADQTARWATTRAEPKTLLERAFSAIAKVLRSIFKVAKDKGYTPDKSFESFLNETLKTKIVRRKMKADAMERAGKRLPRNLRRSRRTIGAAGASENNLFSEEANMSIRTLFEQDLSNEERRVLLNAFTRGSTRGALVRKFTGHPEIQEEIKRDPMAAAVYGYQLWAAGELKVGPQTATVFQTFATQMTETMGSVREHTQAESILTAIRDGVVSARDVDVNGFESAVAIVTKDRRVAQANGVVRKLSEAVGPHMSAVFSSASSRIRGFDNPFLTQLVQDFYVAPGDQGISASYFERRGAETSRYNNDAVRALGKLDEAQMQEVLAAMKDSSVVPEQAISKSALKSMRRLFKEMFTYGKDAGLKMGNAGTKMPDGSLNYLPRVWDMTKLQQRRSEFIEMLLQPKYFKEMRRLASERSVGLGDDKVVHEALSIEELAEVITDSMLKQNEGLADTPINPDNISHIPFVAAMNERVLDFLDESDVATFTSDDLQTTVLTYINQLTKRAEFVRKFGNEGQRVEELLDKAETAGATEEQIAASEAFVDAMQGTYGIDFDNNYREFIEKVRAFVKEGGKIDRLLKKLQDIDPNTINSIIITWNNVRLLALATLSSLIDLLGPALRGDMKSAWAGYTAGVEAFIGEIQAKKSGDRRPDLVEIAEALGIINENMTNQTLAWEFGTQHMGKQARHINDAFFKYTGLTAWTRMTRLMATASAEAWLMRQVNSPTKDTARWLSELNLEIEDIKLTADGRIQFLTRAERNKLREEGGEVLRVDSDGNIEISSDATAELARDDRVRNAMTRWVNGAILRPNAAQRPIWASSPAWQLVFHLKGFMYSAHETWLKRVVSEIGEGNMMPMVYFLGMVPLMAASDWLRDRVQNFGQPAPYKANWGFTDHLKNSAERAGIFGIGQIALDMEKDARYNGIESIADFGSPTTDLTGDIHDVFGGNPRRTTLESIYRLAPANNVWRNWPFVPE